MGPRKNASWAPSGDHVGHQPDVSHVSARDGTSMIAIRYLAVYRRVEGEWQLVAWQSTRLPD